MTTTPDVRVRLSAEGVSEVVSALKSVQAQAQQTSAKSSKGFGLLNGVLGNMKGMLGGLSAYLSVRSFTNWISGGARLADEMQNVSQQIGTTVERLSALNHLARTSDVDLGVMRQAASLLARKLDDLKEGSPGVVAAFKRIGLSVRDFSGMDTAEAMALVSDRLSRMADGTEKVAIVTDLFGRSGARLIPMMNELGREGLPAVIDAARELGLILDNQTAASIEAMNDDFDTMKLQSQTLAAQFVGGLAPDIRVALGSIGDALADSGQDFKLWGQDVGTVFKALALVLSPVVALVATTLDLVWTMLKTVVIGLWDISNAGALLIEGKPRDAVAALRGSLSEINATLDGFWDRQNRRGEHLGAVIKAITAESSGGDAGTAGAAGAVSSMAEDYERSFYAMLASLQRASRERLDITRAALQNELSLFKAQAKLRNEADKQAFNEGLTTLQDYYAARRQAILDETNTEIALLLKERALLDSEQEEKKRLAEQQKIDAKITQLRVEAETEIVKLTGEEREAIRELAEQRASMEREVLEAQGRRHEAAIAQIEEEIRKYDELLAKQGISPEERAPLVATRRRTMTAVADFEESQRQAQLAMDEIDLARQEIQRKVDQGLISEIEGQRRIAQVERDRLPQLQDIAAAMLAFAEITTDPELIQKARELASALKDLGTASRQVDELAKALESFNANLKAAAVDSLTDALAGIGTETQNARQAIKAFARDFAAAVQRMIAQIIALQVVESALSLFGGGAKVEAKAEGGAVEGRSGGGLIRGPGTGTSDSIIALGPGRPIRISAGEYIVRAREAQRPGALRFLSAFNSGRFDARELLRMVDVSAFARGGLVERGMAVPIVIGSGAFAGGGAVAEAAAVGRQRDGKLLIGLEPGLVLRNLDSPDGERLIVKTIVRNRRALSQLWG